MNTAVSNQDNPWVAGPPVIQADAIHVFQNDYQFQGQRLWRVVSYRGSAQLPTDLMTGAPDVDATLITLKSYMDRGMIKPAQVVLYFEGQVIEVTPEMMVEVAQ